jgi:hypothetical protein
VGASLGRAILCLATFAVLAPTAGASVSSRPCDLYARGGTPCVAAYSTTRAMYARYSGPLYRVMRARDGAKLRIRTLPSGYADAAAQDRFCASTRCEIIVLYDQSPGHNDLRIAGPGGNGGQNVGVTAGRLPVTVSGHPAYGMYFDAGMGYRDNHTTGVATGAAPESMYMVTSGTHFNSRCCFDFGNAETNAHDTGNGHMDAIYFGTQCWFEWPTCYGKGPWVEADMENGVFFSDTGGSQDPGDTGDTNPFVTAMLKNNGTNAFAIKDGDAQGGPVATRWSGALPNSPFDPDPPAFTIRAPKRPSQTMIVNPALSGYRPMRKEGSVILGTGGDDSNYAVGSFFEGAMTRGYATDATDNAVQANIAAARYGRCTQPPAALLHSICR